MLKPFILLASLIGCALAAQPVAAEETRPNILFIMFDDLSPNLGAYGHRDAQTPVLDQLANQSVVYENAFTTAGVCAPSRAALMMGMHQQSFGAQHMSTNGFRLPDGTAMPYMAMPPADAKAFPELLRAAGYYTSNNGKTDYQLGQNFLTGPFTIWDESNAEQPWRGRDEGQPFFAFVNIDTVHERYLFPLDLPEDAHPFAGRILQGLNQVVAGREPVHDPTTIAVPPFLPDTPTVRADIARLLDNLHYAERRVAELLAQLEADGLADSTIVIITSDHGDPLPRAKRSLYNSGLQVPLLIRWPDGEGAGTREGQLVSFVDFAPSILALAGIEQQPSMIGRDFLSGSSSPERGYFFAAMDRHDELPDYSRAVGDGRWKYIRNYRSSLPFFRRHSFRGMLSSMDELWRLHDSGDLPEHLEQYFAPDRPAEELYDTWRDPHELTNLANDARYTLPLRRMRAALDRFGASHQDWSRQSESAMIEALWNRSEQPVTAAPIGNWSGDTLELSSSTGGASIGYRINGGRWNLYSGPIETDLAASIEARAVRYGFLASEITEISR